MGREGDGGEYDGERTSMFDSSPILQPLQKRPLTLHADK